MCDCLPQQLHGKCVCLPSQTALGGSAWSDVDADLAGAKYASMCVAECVRKDAYECKVCSDDPFLQPGCWKLNSSSNRTRWADLYLDDEEFAPPLNDVHVKSVATNELTDLVGSSSGWRLQQLEAALDDFATADFSVLGTEKEELVQKMLVTLTSASRDEEFAGVAAKTLDCIVTRAEKLLAQNLVRAAHMVLCEARQCLYDGKSSSQGVPESGGPEGAGIYENGPADVVTNTLKGIPASDVSQEGPDKSNYGCHPPPSKKVAPPTTNLSQDVFDGVFGAESGTCTDIGSVEPATSGGWSQFPVDDVGVTVVNRKKGHSGRRRGSRLAATGESATTAVAEPEASAPVVAAPPPDSTWADAQVSASPRTTTSTPSTTNHTTSLTLLRGQESSTFRTSGVTLPPEEVADRWGPAFGASVEHVGVLAPVQQPDQSQTPQKEIDTPQERGVACTVSAPPPPDWAVGPKPVYAAPVANLPAASAPPGAQITRTPSWCLPPEFKVKFQCQFLVAIEDEPKFRVIRRLLGSSGANMKAIAQQTGAKLRLRGRGSRFLEGPEQVESTDPLMLCVSCTNRAGYDAAMGMTWQLMKRLYGEYRRFCIKTGKAKLDLRVQWHEGSRAGAR
mmetsp:Transcript_5061/g.14015  ORF Transcript_5061/g.14015 Transcript_5061/m.14015 type:complete len:619 (-) Transcript_5061:147-2003(-)